MSEIIPSRAEAIARLSAPGMHHELVEKTIRGNPCRVFTNAPETIRNLLPRIASGKFDKRGVRNERLKSLGLNQ